MLFKEINLSENKVKKHLHMPSLKSAFNNEIVFLVNFVFSSRPLSNFATCFNDPHCRTFDGKWFELQQAGEYLMYENVETQTRIHVRSLLCNPGGFTWPGYPPPYCLNKIFIQYFYELIRIDVSRNIILYSDYSRNIVNQPVHFDSSGNVKNDLNSLIIKRVGYSFEIITGYGLVLRIYGYVWNYFMYINRYDIIPAKGDAGKIDGLFSNWDNDRTNDLTKLKDGQSSTDLPAIFQSYLASSNNIPSLETSYYSFNSTDISYMHSFCASVGIDFFSSPDQRSPCANGRNEDAFGYQKIRSKRSTDTLEDPIEKINRIGESNSFKKFLSLAPMPHAPRRLLKIDHVMCVFENLKNFS
ncbi:von Willebrand factor D and EGF domain-containing -like isoform X1 [Brachionus plicatilis]|uniref:von Willebrand factor D and EGF domain-containing-like isoform X1 n=1 Tax=Brachionus plicatilis TaxID=10195 RepID=A0A3M7PKJ6_BRAPC|nr:von Willebrand factor D and EGF domain-containing -like isoform X1 [Brachionus plicatilis]